MQHLLSRRRLPALAASLVFALAGLALPLAAHANDDDDRERGHAPGVVYTLGNAAGGNDVLAFKRGSDGTLSPAGSFPTGGLGSGTGLGNQGALVLSPGGHWLFAVNPGSNELTVFERKRGGLHKVDKVASGGVRPVSVTVHGELVYVLHAGSDNLSGFKLDDHGKLTPLVNSIRALSATGTAPAQAEFSRDGEHLVVTEKATNRVLIYPVGDDGLLGTPVIQASPAPTPFGFAFGKRNQLFVSEAFRGQAGKSSLSSYRLQDDGTAALITASAAAPGETAACWVVITRNGRFAYVSNTGSDSLTGYRIARNGAVSLIDGAVSAQTGAGSAPTDIALSRDSRLLFALNPGNGTLSGFAVSDDGKLAPASLTGGIPRSATGFVAR